MVSHDLQYKQKHNQFASTTMQNIIGRKPGAKDESITFIIDGHFDGVSTIQLIADYIAIFLLLFAGSVHLKTSKGIGLLSGAWGYTFCIMYRAFAWRMDALNLEDYEWVELYKIIVGLVVSFIAFVLTLIKTYPLKESN